MFLIGEGLNFMTSMSRSVTRQFLWKNSSIKYSQSYDIVHILALLRSNGLNKYYAFRGQIPYNYLVFCGVQIQCPSGLRHVTCT